MATTVIATWVYKTKTTALIRFDTGDPPPDDTTLGLFTEEQDKTTRPHWEQVPGVRVKDEDWLAYIEIVKLQP